MKEVKLKPIAKLTEVQLQSVRSNANQINSLGRSLDRAYQRKQEILEEAKKAYSLPNVPFYVDLQTGEVFEEWPKA